MKFKNLILTAVMTGVLPVMAYVKPAIPVNPEIEKKVEAKLAKMTLDEKVGQMLELNIDVFGTVDYSGPHPVFTLDEARLDTVISRWKPGSFLNAPPP